MKLRIFSFIALVLCLVAGAIAIRKFARDGSTPRYTDGISESADGVIDPGGSRSISKLPRDEYPSLVSKGDLLIEEGNDFLGAEPFYRAALVLAKETLLSDPGNDELQHRLAIAHMKFGSIARYLYEVEDDVAHFEDALSILKTLIAGNPDDLGYQKDLFACHEFFSDRGNAIGPVELVNEHSSAAIKIAERFSLAEPEDPNWRYALYQHHGLLGDYSKFTGDLGAAEKHYSTSLEMIRSLTDNASASSGLKISLDGYVIEALEASAEVASALGKDSEAKSYLREALKACEVIDDAPRRDIHVRNCLFELGDFHQKQGDWEEALGYYERMMKLVEEDDRVFLQPRIDEMREKLSR